MKLAHVEQLAVLYEPEQGRRIRVGRLARKQRQILFEYDGAFLVHKLEVRHAAAIFEDVQVAVRRFKRHADKAGVPPRLRDATAKVLAGLGGSSIR